MLKRRLAQARIDRLLKPFMRDDTPDLFQYVSGVNEAPTPTIDDGARYEIAERQTPDFVKKDLHGWD